MPDRIANAPETLPGLELYIRAFFDLDRDRPIGFSEGYIPRRSIADWAKDYELDEDQTEALFYFIREMDSEVMRIKQAKAEKQKQQQTPPRRLKKR